MKVFILRHGEAEAHKTTDAARQLTPHGRADVAASVHYSLNELKSVEQIWASPLVRAQQTAAIAQGILSQYSSNLTVTTSENITPEANPSDLFALLQQANSGALLLVSHQPLVSDFIDLFCGSTRGFHPMDTASLAYIECEIAATNLGELRWLRHVHG